MGSVGISTKHSWGVNHGLLQSLSEPVPAGGEAAVPGEERGPPSLRWWALTAPSQIRASQKGWQPSQCREISLQHAQHPFPPVQLMILAFCLTVCCASAVCSGETGVSSWQPCPALTSVGMPSTVQGRSACSKKPCLLKQDHN